MGQKQENTQYGLKNHLELGKRRKLSTNLFEQELIHKSGHKLRVFILALSNSLIRFHYSFAEDFKLNINPYLEFENFNYIDQEFLQDIGDKLVTQKLTIEIKTSPLSITIYDKAGELISSDEPGIGFWSKRLNHLETKCKGNPRHEVRCYKQYQNLANPPYIYGLGDKTGSINRWGRRFRNAPIDALGYDGEFTDPLYKDIPFFIHLEPSSQKAHGIFFDNFNPKFFDFGRERKPSPYYYFGAEAGDLNYYFFYGPDIKSIVSEYLELTGKPVPMPSFTFGYLASGMSYTENTNHHSGGHSADELLLNTFKRFKDNDISASAFHLSSGYIQDQNGQRQQFIWNQGKFPNPLKFSQEARELGVELCTNVKPVLLTTHPWYQEAADKGLFIERHPEEGEARRQDPLPLIIDYWGGQGSYLDFKNPDTQKWWKDKLKQYILANGIRGIWNDNNEYEIFEPHTRQGEEMEMPIIMARLAYEASLEANPDVAPWVLSRSGYTGIQKYAQSWVGDNYSSWKSLQYDNAILASCGLSGLIHMGVDIGGFFGPNPEPELFLRWIQNGIFTPRFCIHSYKPIPTEPDMFKDSHPEHFKIIQKFIKLRQELIPYIEEQSLKASTQGVPIMRPTVYDFQNDPKTYEQSFEYMFGDKYLVAPIYKPSSESTSRELYLPGRGSTWTHYFTGEQFQGGSMIELKVNLDEIPVFEQS